MARVAASSSVSSKLSQESDAMIRSMTVVLSSLISTLRVSLTVPSGSIANRSVAKTKQENITVQISIDRLKHPRALLKCQVSAMPDFTLNLPVRVTSKIR